MPYKIKTFTEISSGDFDNNLNKFIADKNIKVHNITFCSIPDTYIAHVAFSLIEDESEKYEYH